MALSEKQIKLVEGILYAGSDEQLQRIAEYCGDLTEFREQLTAKRDER